MTTNDLIKIAILDAMQSIANQSVAGISSTQLLQSVKTSSATLKRHLEDLVTSGQIIRSGKARATRYRLALLQTKREISIAGRDSAPSSFTFPKSAASQALLISITQPLAARVPVTYRRELVDEYIPNETALLPKHLADSLAREGRMIGQQPAGTYARKVLEPLLIDLSWSSSRLEGNKYSLLATEELFKRGVEGGDADATMLLNHKRAIEFLVDAVPEYGLTMALICNLHSILMQDLMMDAKRLGEIRTKIVHISDTVYVPSQMPKLLGEMFALIIARSKQIKNPIEAAFFLWVNIAYLQPFEDGNKRTSRLTANIPLMLYNCAPLSFMDIDAKDYAYAMMGVYESRDMSLAIDLFVWTYRRSIQKYAVVMESVAGPDPFRLKYREYLTAAMQQIVRDRLKKNSVLVKFGLQKDDRDSFAALLNQELSALTLHNCARYRLAMKATEEWIAAGRPE